MCVAIEYFVDGKPLCAHGGESGIKLPTCDRNGAVTWYTWETGRGEFVCDEEPGYLHKWPAEPWVPLEVIKRGEWWQFKPEPVRISASRFLIYRNNDSTSWEQWIALKPGEYLQGALARRYGHARVYVVSSARRPSMPT